MKKLNLIDYKAVGEENAITAKTLARLLGLRERDITLMINALRKSGELICSGSNGFWLPADNEDVKMFVRQMQSRIKDMQKAMTPAIEHLKTAAKAE